MTLEKLMEEAKKFLSGPENFVAAEDALRPELAGMRIYEEPIFGVAAADDPLFLELRRPEVVHPGRDASVRLGAGREERRIVLPALHGAGGELERAGRGRLR